MATHTDHPDQLPERHYLAGLDLAGRRVVVVGAGVVAQRRLPWLIASGAAVEVIAPEATPAVEALADSGEIIWIRRGYAAGDLSGAWYAVAAASDPEVNAAVGAEAERQRVFCVRADDARKGSAVTPAVAQHDGLSFGVLAGGKPRRSAAVRDAILESLQSGVVDEHAEPHAAGVALVGGGPGAPDLITVRGRRLLAKADVVLTDHLAPRELLAELGSHVEVIDVSKIPYGRAANQDVINRTLIDKAHAGRFVVRLKGGDPYLFGRGFEELLACVESGVPVTVAPGVTSAFAAPAAVDVPVTHRGVAHEVVVVSGHVAPDDERSLTDWSALGRLRGTIVLLMAVQRIEVFAEALIRYGRPAETPAAVVQEATTGKQRVVRGTLGTIAKAVRAEGIKPPAVIVIGPVASLAP
jgi:uroporphyrin-III C-methyltransferase/precorrin-2 dehydrogenase/sirohydrochlorin ferrochelatase